MKRKRTLIALKLTFCILASGCSTTLTEGQKAQLTEVSLGRVAAVGSAYHSPDATKSPGMANAVPAATGGGLIPALIGSAIDAGVKSKQRGDYSDLYGEFSLRIDSIYSGSPEEALKTKLESYLKEDAFFSSRLVESAASVFEVTIEEMGFVRAAESPKGAMSLVYELSGRVTLRTPSEPMMLNLFLSGASRYSAEPQEIAQNPALKTKFVGEAVDSFVEAFRAQMDTKLGRR